jgi:hypothetical protein
MEKSKEGKERRKRREGVKVISDQYDNFEIIPGGANILCCPVCYWRLPLFLSERVNENSIFQRKSQSRTSWSHTYCLQND